MSGMFVSAVVKKEGDVLGKKGAKPAWGSR
jgi:hypothetical protein